MQVMIPLYVCTCNVRGEASEVVRPGPSMADIRQNQLQLQLQDIPLICHQAAREYADCLRTDLFECQGCVTRCLGSATMDHDLAMAAGRL